MNQFCIMKLGSKIINGDDDLWCNIMRCKYKVEDNRGVLQEKRVNSNMWKAIVKTSPNLIDVGLWHIGEGNHIHPWTHSWTDRGKIFKDFNVAIHVELAYYKLRDLVDIDGKWNWSLMAWILDDVKLKITIILPLLTGSGVDKLITAIDEEGNFAIGHLYKELTQDGNLERSKEWNLICSCLSQRESGDSSGC
ncbi:unnamed protein product [Vicia faba]|nr:unnamed protein product [Vicia faba]